MVVLPKFGSQQRHVSVKIEYLLFAPFEINIGLADSTDTNYFVG